MQLNYSGVLKQMIYSSNNENWDNDPNPVSWKWYSYATKLQLKLHFCSVTYNNDVVMVCIFWMNEALNLLKNSEWLGLMEGV